MPNTFHTQLLYIENYQIACYAVEGFGSIPVIDGWVQFSLAAKYIPSLTEQTETLKALADLTQRGKQEKLIQTWYFLRKSPGIKVRFHITAIESIAWLAREINKLSWQWLGQIEADSAFAQRELLQAHYPDNYAVILDVAATAITQAIPAKDPCNLSLWVEFTCYFTRLFIPDPWLAWEALGRFEKMRSQPVGQSYPAQSYYSPETLFHKIKADNLAFMLPSHSPVLTGTLMLLNYLFNIWGIDAITQATIIKQTRDQLRPSIAGNDIR